jgi:transcriptional regulator with XRE-family HTH domain
MVLESVALQHPRKIRATLGFSRERMARLFGVSAKTIERWEARESLPANLLVRQRLAQVQEIATLGRIAYTPEGLTLFLTAPMPVFHGRTALQLIESGQADEVFAALATDYEGLGP